MGLRKNIKIKGVVVKKPISCRYAFPAIPLDVMESHTLCLALLLWRLSPPGSIFKFCFLLGRFLYLSNSSLRRGRRFRSPDNGKGAGPRAEDGGAGGKSVGGERESACKQFVFKEE